MPNQSLPISLRENYRRFASGDHPRWMPCGETLSFNPDINPDNPFSMTLAVGAHRIPVVVVPNTILATSEDDEVPFIVGDLKEYCKIFDRQQLSIMTSNVAAVGSGNDALNAFEEDLTLFRGIMRLDVEVLDAGAIVNGYITVAGAGPEGATGETGN